nr:CRTAC1 family protein [Candidatus Krumholzibacteria bacterium]
AFQEIKAQYPSLPVATAGLACKQPVFRSYLEALLDEENGIFDLCDAFGLHSYTGRAFEVLNTYHEVCAEKGYDPKPVWMTEFGRELAEVLPGRQYPEYTLNGARAFPEHILEVFSSFGVERAMTYCVFDPNGGGLGGFNLFDWNEENSTLTPNLKWDFYKAAAEKHQNFRLGSSIGFGNSDGVDMFGISPIEWYFPTPENPETESAFEFLDSTTEYPISSRTLGSQVLAIAFDLNDSWVDQYSNEKMIVEAEVFCSGNEIQIRHQSCCETGFLATTPRDSVHFATLQCASLTEGLQVVSSYPDYVKGVGYLGNIISHSVTVTPGSWSTVSIQLDDWAFINGMEPRADISFVTVGNQPFEIRRVEIYPVRGDVVYEDKSTETQLAYTGQPRNAMAWDFSGDGLKDLLITKYDGNAIANLNRGIGLSGAPQMRDETQSVFQSSSPPLLETDGIITADFDNDGLVDFFAPNHLSGGRLFKNVDGDHFEDITSASGLSNSSWANVLGHAHSGAWADYDGDGFPDLTIVASEGGLENDFNTLLVLHNNNGFFDLAAIIPSNSVGMSPLWADFDNDGDLDLVILGSAPTAVGEDPPAYLNVAYLNQGNGTFVEHYFSTDIFNNYFGNRIAAVSDYDNDGDFDVIFADEQSVSVVENGNPQYFPSFFWGSSSFGENNLPSGIIGVPVDLAVLDYDLDGFQDVLVTYGEIQSTSVPSDIVLFANREGLNSTRVLVNETNPVGLADYSKSAGMAVADFNQDGFSDIYFSKASNNSFFFKAKPAIGYAQNNWIGLRLISNNGLTCSNGLGTKATVEYGSALQAQVVDGGSGLASQHQADLVFGLGEFAGEVAVNIVWPNGHSQTATFSVLNQYHTVLSDIPRVDNATVQFSRNFQVNSEVEDWVFSWETFGEGIASLDQVIFDLQSVPTRCWPEHSMLSDALNSVTTVVSELGDGKFLHTLTYTGVECTPRCAIPYTVESAQPSFPNTSDLNSASIKFCVQSQ